MALKLYERYPQLWESPSSDYPQGAFKNLSAQGETDGSYLEKDWLNDYSGFFGALLRDAEMTPNGEVDTAKKSQFYDALVAVAKKVVGEEGYRKLDDNVFNGYLQVRSEHEGQGIGVFLQDTDGTVRGQVVATDQGLQLTQYPKNDGLQTFTFPTSGDGGEIVLKQDLANPDKGAAMVGRGAVAVDSIADLLTLPAEQRREDLLYLVKGYHSGSMSGGNAFSWQPSLPSSSHNGGTIIALEKEFPSDWSDIPTVEEWFTPPATGSGCFVVSKTDSTRVASAEFGVTAGVVYSQRPAYQAALNSLASTGGLVISGVDSINLDTDMTGVALDVPNNVWIDNRSCKLKMLPTDLGGYSVVMFSERVIDLSGIFGGEIIGDKHTHLGTSGEWGMGINIRGASAVVVRDISSNQCWGDGIYIGAGVDDPKQAGTILLDNVVCDDNRRQGLSIVHAKKVVITRGEFTRTSGAEPQAGIDIEPNLGGEVTEVEFGEVYCSGNAGMGFFVVAPNQPAKIGKITGQRIIAKNNIRAGVSVETTDEFHCAHVYSEGNGGSGLDIVSVGKSDIRLLDCRDNRNTSAVRSDAVNYRNTNGSEHSVGRMTVQGGSPSGSALGVFGVMGAVFECDSITVNGVNHSATYAVALTTTSGESATVNIGGLFLSDLPSAGLFVGAGVVTSISRVTLDRLNTKNTGSPYGISNNSAQARFGSIYAADGSNLYHVLRNLGDRSIFNSVVASPAALSEAGTAILDTSTGSIVVAQILS